MPPITSDAPITHERALADLRAILYSAQHNQSVMLMADRELPEPSLDVFKQLMSVTA
jgi:hypothetical protein